MNKTGRKGPFQPGGDATRFPCGHPRTEDNFRKVGNGEIRCRECRKTIDARYHLSKKIEQR